MKYGREPHPRGTGSGALTAWLNRRLFPILGPPPVGPSGSDLRAAGPVPVRGCPVCDQPMEQHEIDRSGERTRLHCPITRP